MRRIILFSISLLIISCNDLKKENFKIANSINPEVNPDLFSDSLFVGEPLIKQADFVRNLDEGGDNFRYIKEFETLLKKHNKKYANYKSNSFIKALKVSDKLTLELKRKNTIQKIKTLTYKLCYSQKLTMLQRIQLFFINIR